jgi:hypothetical protein
VIGSWYLLSNRFPRVIRLDRILYFRLSRQAIIRPNCQPLWHRLAVLEVRWTCKGWRGGDRIAMPSWAHDRSLGSRDRRVRWPAIRDPKNWNPTEEQRACFVVSGRSTFSLTRRAKEGYNFPLAGLLRQLSQRLSVCISALAKRRKAFQKSRGPPGISKLDGISKVS